MKTGLRKHKKRQTRIVATKTANKIARVEKTELDRAFHEQLAEIVRERDAKLHEAGTAYRRAIKAGQGVHEVARARAWKDYDERREAILKSLGAETQAA